MRDTVARLIAGIYSGELHARIAGSRLFGTHSCVQSRPQIGDNVLCELEQMQTELSDVVRETGTAKLLTQAMPREIRLCIT